MRPRNYPPRPPMPPAQRPSLVVTCAIAAGAYDHALDVIIDAATRRKQLTKKKSRGR